MLTIRTYIRRRDLIMMNFQMLPRLRSNWITWLCIALLVGAYIVYQSGLPDTPLKMLGAALAMIFGATGGVLGGFLFSLSCVLFMSRADNGVLGEHIYTMREDGLHESTAANESLTKWHGLMDLRRTSSYIYVQVAPALFHVIPRKDFENAAAFEIFWKELSTRTKRRA